MNLLVKLLTDRSDGQTDKRRVSHTLLGRGNNFYRAMLRIAQWCHSKLSVRPSVTFRYRDHIHVGWNTSKKISRPNSLRHLLSLTQHRQSGPTGTPQKLGGIGVGLEGQRTCNIFETVQDRTKITMTDEWEVAYAFSIGTKINDLRWP